MKAVQTLAIGLAAFAPLASAWPKWLPDVDALIVRQNDETTAAATATQAASATTGAKASATTAEETATGTGGAKTTNLNTAKLPTGTNTKTGTAKATGTNTESDSSQTTFDARDPPGSVVMIDPAAAANSINLYKIGDYVTWKWNYTNIQATPTAIDVLVSCSTRSQTWTLTQNMTFAEPAAFTWDTNAQATDGQAPLAVDTYTLVIYDADSEVTATPAAGYLGSSNPLTFGMYTPQPYTPLASWECATCDSAAPALDGRAINMAVGMSILTVASFTWFVAGVGIF